MVLQASTFNLNGRKPPADLDLTGYVAHWQSSWPEREEESAEGSYEKADIYIMGFQEAVPLTAQNIIAGDGGASGASGDLVRVFVQDGRRRQLVGIMQSIAASIHGKRESHAECKTALSEMHGHRNEEISQTLTPTRQKEESVIDFYLSGWSGVPSANLASRVQNSLSEVP